MRPKVIDLCCGAGGLSLGFQQAGFDIAAAVDADQDNVKFHDLNFGECEGVTGYLGNFIQEDAPFVSKYRGKVDVVIGGPPCQGFSIIGKRSEDDLRSKVLLEFAILAAELQPEIIVAENVRGLLMKWGKNALEEYSHLLEARGYALQKPLLLNAAQHGVPQNRFRVFLIAKRGATSDAIDSITPARRDAVSVWDAIHDLEDIHNTGSVNENGEFIGVLKSQSMYASLLSKHRNLCEAPLTGCKLPIHTPDIADRFRSTKPGDTDPKSRLARLEYSGVSTTIRAGSGPTQGSFMAARPIHPRLPRCITVREAARLHGFPDDFVFSNSHWHGFRQIGNSVPPPLAKVVATECLSLL